MYFDIFKPHKALDTFIRYYWLLRVPCGSSQDVSQSDASQQFLTEGIELSFNLGDPIEIAMGDSIGKTVESVSISGPLTKPMKMRANGRIEIFGVCFRPGGAYPFFPYPAHELTNCLADTQELWGTKGASLVECFFNTCLTSKDRVEYLDRFFLHQLKQNNRKDDSVSAAILAIELYKGFITIDYLAKTVGVSCRHLERKFKERVGLSPKQLCRNLRFKNALSRKIQNPEGSWLETALDSGYYDQAHMIMDFKHFTGLSPSAYFKNPTTVDPFFTANF
ncbi:MAG: helix-turn-helix domain-containing protein [Proteobacteria bacterium]|nr:helix-turn-helix domain-containing protein [Pseudomonadota bacterium]